MNAPEFATQDRFSYLKQQLARPRAGRTWRGLGLVWLPIALIVLMCFDPPSWAYDSWYPAVFAILITFVPIFALISYGDRLDKQQRIPLLDELTRLDDLRAVGLLLTLPETVTWEVASSHSPYSHSRCPPEIRQALIRLLPRLQPADALHLTGCVAEGFHWVGLNAQTSLHNLLNDENAELVVAVLIALMQVGTPAALPFVGPLATGRKSPRIQAAAQHCYAVLAEPLARMQMPATLLRGASAPADTLLRPALPGAEPPSEELLRAHPPQPLS